MRELIFQITIKDFNLEYYRGSGKGGQKRNKTSSAVRIKHPPSGASGQCENFREQSRNRKEAFKRLAKTDEIKRWIDLEGKKIIGSLGDIEEEIDRTMKEVKIEIREDNKWVEVKCL